MAFVDLVEIQGALSSDHDMVRAVRARAFAMLMWAARRQALMALIAVHVLSAFFDCRLRANDYYIVIHYGGRLTQSAVAKRERNHW